MGRIAYALIVTSPIRDSVLFSGVIDIVKVYRYGTAGWNLKTTAGTHPPLYHPFHYVNGQPNDYIKQKYFFHFLSPSSYAKFVVYVIDGRLFDGEFRGELEYLLDK